jgi:hypothetical protein
LRKKLSRTDSITTTSTSRNCSMIGQFMTELWPGWTSEEGQVSKDSPEPRKVQADGDIDRVAVANGLHHYYFRKAA